MTAYVAEIQTMLKNKGFNPGKIDGDWGKNTAQAVIAALSTIKDVEEFKSDIPKWISKAYNYIGLKEIHGKQHNEKILEFWKEIRASFTDDETPWCAGFVGGVLEECGIRSSRSASARSYMNWGAKLDEPAVGAIVVFWRGDPKGYSGHVGFVVGKDGKGNIMVLGGNQGDEVNVKPFSTSRVLGYRWPLNEECTQQVGIKNLPTIGTNYSVSTNEA